MYAVFWKYPILMIVLGVLLFIFTFENIEKIKVVRGIYPGRTFVDAKVTKKYVKKRKGDFDYCLAFDKRLESGFYWVNVPKAIWDSYKTGDSIQLIKIPTAQGLFVNGGFGTNHGRFEFEYSLLCLEVLMVIVGVFRFVKVERIKTIKGMKSLEI